jgi:DNA-binding response OmpR family regulator
MNILIVDDEAAVAELLKSFCDGKGQVSTCTSSLEAVARLASTPTDLLVTDIVMPKLDGLSLVREARKVDANLEAIVVTGYASIYSIDQVLQSGASDLILKPVRMQEFRARVELALERRRERHLAVTRERDLHGASREMIEGLQRELAGRRPSGEKDVKKPS